VTGALVKIGTSHITEQLRASLTDVCVEERGSYLRCVRLANFSNTCTHLEVIRDVTAAADQDKTYMPLVACYLGFAIQYRCFPLL
jgi:hypothetical protein